VHVYFRMAAVAAAAVLALPSCSPPPVVPGPAATPGASAPVSPLPPQTQPSATATGNGAAGPDAGSGTEAPPSTSSGGLRSRSPRWGRYGGRQEACVAVAANVAVLLLVPLSFLTEVDEEELSDLEAQIAKTRNQVPRALDDDFANLEEVLAENNDQDQFDDEAFLDAVEPIQDWLAANCAS
jgi:hypothetical protein